MREAEHLLADVPLSQRLIRKVHATLLSGVRGQSKSPGEYRKIPNWIGPARCTIDTAHFVPISAEKLPAGMDAWEKFIHADYLDCLVQLALLHVEFEALHPFLDGNGRLGRIFVPLFMWQKGIISRPMFISALCLKVTEKTTMRTFGQPRKPGHGRSGAYSFCRPCKSRLKITPARPGAFWIFMPE